MRDDESLVYGIISCIGAVLCFIWLKGGSLSLFGLVSMKYSTIGIILLVIGAFNLLVSGVIGELLGWILEHWFLLVLVAAALVFLKNNGKFDGFSFPKFRDETRQVQAEVPETVYTEPTEDSWYRPHWNTGICQNLDEEVFVVALFIDDAQKKWEDYTISWFLENKVEPGLRFIEEEAAEYGRNIRLEYLTYTGIPTAQTLQVFPDGNARYEYDILEDAARGLGFSTAQEMLAYHREYTGVQQIAYLVCSVRDGRPYAWWSESADPDALEYCVVFCNSANSDVSSYNTIFHEVLHLFGAEDYYAEGTDRVSRAKLAQQLCPNDVMLRSYSAGLRDIGRYTAYCIGWLDEMPAEYNRPEWWS